MSTIFSDLKKYGFILLRLLPTAVAVGGKGSCSCCVYKTKSTAAAPFGSNVDISKPWIAPRLPGNKTCPSSQKLDSWPSTAWLSLALLKWPKTVWLFMKVAKWTPKVSKMDKGCQVQSTTFDWKMSILAQIFPFFSSKMRCLKLAPKNGKISENL